MSEKTDVDVPAQLPAVFPTGGALPVPEWWSKRMGNRLYISSIDPEKGPARRKDLLRHLLGTTIDAATIINTEIDIVDFTLMPAGGEVQGELREWVRCVLGCADGRIISTSGVAMMQTLGLISQFLRPAPFRPPVKCKLIRTANKLDPAKSHYELKVKELEDLLGPRS